MEKMRTVDLFAGVGGIRIAFEKNGFKTVYSNDFDRHAKITYDLNFSDTPLHLEDFSKVNINQIPEFEVLLAGFPCQPFSIAGYKKGFEDEGRGNMFFEIIKLLKKRMPKVIVLENVKNLKTHDKGNTFKVIKQSLESLGYNVKAEILNSMTHGNLPQNRERIFIIGFLARNHFINFNFPGPSELTNSFKDYLEENVDEKYYYNNKEIYQRMKNEIISEDTVYQWRRKYVRANKSGVCPTLTANMGTGGHNVPLIKDKKGVRKLTPKECFLLQGFPFHFKLPDIADSHLYKQAGNSVPVPLLEKIAENIKLAVEGKPVPYAKEQHILVYS